MQFECLMQALSEWLKNSQAVTESKHLKQLRFPEDPSSQTKAFFAAVPQGETKERELQ